ncbi:hypothetical protein F2Q69_00040347 [Brassica cretica]|uniref:Uncharacterized protein n=1 Tax=Brassica cretica TaxID=69181 RepID=A0A8S9NMK7_BRACR|nr:hypothetical protein F2Q69_00040347 [Brassica cretica]
MEMKLRRDSRGKRERLLGGAVAMAVLAVLAHHSEDSCYVLGFIYYTPYANHKPIRWTNIIIN